TRLTADGGALPTSPVTSYGSPVSVVSVVDTTCPVSQSVTTVRKNWVWQPSTSYLYEATKFDSTQPVPLGPLVWSHASTSTTATSCPCSSICAGTLADTVRVRVCPGSVFARYRPPVLAIRAPVSVRC